MGWTKSYLKTFANISEQRLILFALRQELRHAIKDTDAIIRI